MPPTQEQKSSFFGFFGLKKKETVVYDKQNEMTEQQNIDYAKYLF